MIYCELENRVSACLAINAAILVTAVPGGKGGPRSKVRNNAKITKGIYKLFFRIEVMLRYLQEKLSTGLLC